jgi:nicotinamide mononucleotide (NMN) deamidase PncC
MAAAPDMLHALQVALKALESCTAGDYSTGHVMHQSFDEAAVTYAENAALAAIAKATGATQ